MTAPLQTTPLTTAAIAEPSAAHCVQTGVSAASQLRLLSSQALSSQASRGKGFGNRKSLPAAPTEQTTIQSANLPPKLSERHDGIIPREHVQQLCETAVPCPGMCHPGPESSVTDLRYSSKSQPAQAHSSPSDMLPLQQVCGSRYGCYCPLLPVFVSIG